MNRVITINREFGSGGRELARRLSEELKIAYYDQEIIAAIAEDTELSVEYVNNIIYRKPFFSYPITIGNRFYLTGDQMFQQVSKVSQSQSSIIRELAEKSDCIIVGRCANYILREQNPFRIFVYADMPGRMRRCREKAPADEHLSDSELKRQINRMDKNRTTYYETFTGEKWRDWHNYDLCINTSDRVIKDIVPYLARLFRD
ncbi:MAG: cytidylate kinase-like family protein [Eubacterium sp.]|nr:cytidylate kinase-like family protein [Eubacterium sp.]